MIRIIDWHRENENVRVSFNKLAKYFFLLYIFLVLSLPDGIKNMTCLYKMSTRGLPLVYTYNYYFSILEIPIIIMGLCAYKKSSIIRFEKVIILIAIINVIFFITNQEFNIFSNKSYEMFLLLITGFSTATVVLWIADSIQEVEKILDCFIILQFILQIINMIIGASGTTGRYSAIGMGSGATASLAGEYLIWNFFSRVERIKIIPTLCAIVSILLTGSRSISFALLFVVLVFSGRLIRRQYRKNKRMVLFGLCLGIPLMLILAIVVIRSGKFATIDRVKNLLQGSIIYNISNDDSFLGRMRSIIGGIELLKNHPFGIPNSIYAIEYYSAYFFNMEYPHSTVLSYTLLWTPVVIIICIIYIIRLLIKCVYRKLDDKIYLFYYLLVSTFYGAPILYSKVYAFSLIAISLVAYKSRQITNREK